MKKLIFIITLGVCLNASGQDKVGYNLEYDEPENVSNLFVCIDLPIGYDFNNVQDFDIMAGGSFYFDIWDRFNITTSYRRSVYNLDKLASGNTNPSEIPVFNNFELGGAYYFSSRVKDTKTKVRLRTSHGYKYDYVYSAIIPHQGKIMYGLRAGMQAMGSHIYIPSEISIVNPSNAYSDKYLKYKMTGFYLGVQRSKAINLGVDVEGYGFRGMNQYELYAFDVMFCNYKINDKAGNSMDNIFFDVDGTNISLKEGIKSAIGMRIMYVRQKCRTNKLLGTYIRIEVGLRPGYENDKVKLGLAALDGIVSRAYASMSYGITFNGKIAKSNQ